MNYKKFIAFNIVGAILWVTLMLGSGWLLGQVPFVKERFELIVIGIVVVSVLPMVVEWWKVRSEKPQKEDRAEAARHRIEAQHSLDQMGERLLNLYIALNQSR